MRVVKSLGLDSNVYYKQGLVEITRNMSQDYSKYELLPELMDALKVDGPTLLRDIVSLMSAMIRNQCINYGDGKCREIKSIETLAKYFDQFGISYETHHRPDKPLRPSLLATIGDGEPRVMLGPGHVDVVPVREDPSGHFPGWTHPPFDAHIDQDMLYGRGAVDMLNTVAAQAVVFAYVHKAKIPVRGSLLFCAVSDEEASGVDGVGYLLSDPQLQHVFRADYCMTELGGACMIDSKGRPTNVVFQANSEKGVATLELVCKGRGGHGSVPLNSDNALAKAAEVIRRLHAFWCPTVITDDWRSFVCNLDAPWLIRMCLVSSWLLPALIRLLLWLKSPLGPIAHALTRMTITTTHVKGTLKANVIPGEVTVEADVRLLVGQDEKYIMAQLERALGRSIIQDREHYSFRIREFTPATRSPTDTPLWRCMEAAARRLRPGCRL